MPTLDELAPTYVREKRIDLMLEPTAEAPHANRPLTIIVGTSRTTPAGVAVGDGLGLALPLVFEVQGPSPSSYQQRYFLKHLPTQIIFTPREGGRHNVTLREVAHNRFWGSLAVQVAGETL
jgi:hypothetical protein